MEIKTFLSEKLCCQKIVVKKKFELKKKILFKRIEIFGPNNFLVQRKIWLNKFFGQKKFDPKWCDPPLGWCYPP